MTFQLTDIVTLSNLIQNGVICKFSFYFWFTSCRSLTSCFYSFAPAPEIQAYFAAAAKKYDATKFIKLEHKVVSAIWNAEEGKWKVKVQDASGLIFDDECDVLVNAMGVLKLVFWLKCFRILTDLTLILAIGNGLLLKDWTISRVLYYIVQTTINLYH